MENIFKDVKVGEKLYSLRYGEVTVIKLNPEPKNKYPILVTDKYTDQYSFMLNGYYNEDDSTRDLYWNKPEIIEKKRIVTIEENVHICKSFLNNQSQKLWRDDVMGDDLIPAKLIYQIER